MGNAHAKESRSGRSHPGGLDAGGGASSQDRPISRSRRASRPELAVLGLNLGSSSSSRQQQQESDNQPFERRETKQEREARRLERERAARIKERERSVKEEHVDGGYLVTMGVYTASEDFNKAVVRQLQLERRLAPFWRGLDDVKDNWAEHQIIAAARGLDIPPVDEVPEHLVPQPLPPTESPGQSSQNLNNLTVPLGPRTLSAASDKTASNPGSSLPSPTTAGPTRSPGSPLKPHKKALAAALSISSRSGSQTDITPREINLPNDPFVNGQPLEVFLYKEAIECPVCFLYYPPYLNRTRCCDQAICSECFIQIKRPDPHLPEHHGENNEPDSNPDALSMSADPEEVAGELISEAACCPYCTAPDFGVTYEPPPFRRGLTYTYNPSSFGAMGTAMSSTSSLNSNLSPTSATAPSQFGRRRAQSLSANAPGVVTTDRVRPDWSTKLAAARAHQRRRAAAADALHHAAFVMSQVESSRGGLFGRSGRFGRRNTGNREGDSPGGTNNGSGSVTPSPLGPEPGPRISSSRTGPSRERIDAAHLESMMMAEAIRLSLADEEERRRKAEKEAKKEAKKKEKEERKAAKRRTDVYGGSGSGASSSSLSLGLGRRRGNSAASNLRVEASVAAASNASTLQSQAENAEGEATAKGKEVDRGSGDNSNDHADSQGLSATSVGSLPIPNPQSSSHSGRGPSHLRQMSNASSVSSSEPGSYMSHGLHAQDPRSSGLSLAGRSEDGETSATEPLFNFRSLAEMVGVSVDGEEEVQTPGSEQISPGSKNGDGTVGEHVEHIERVDGVGPVRSTGKDGNQPIKVDTSATSQGTDSSMSPPHLMITPETPAPLASGEEESKRLGHVDTPEAPHQATQ